MWMLIWEKGFELLSFGPEKLREASDEGEKMERDTQKRRRRKLEGAVPISNIHLKWRQ
jgi:hypothetical protein